MIRASGRAPQQGWTLGEQAKVYRLFDVWQILSICPIFSTKTTYPSLPV